MSYYPIAYAYEADTHCTPCAVSRFGHLMGERWIPDYVTDSEGNGVGAIFPWDEWCEPNESGTQILACGTCHGIIEEHEHEFYGRTHDTSWAYLDGEETYGPGSTGLNPFGFPEDDPSVQHEPTTEDGY